MKGVPGELVLAPSELAIGRLIQKEVTSELGTSQELKKYGRVNVDRTHGATQFARNPQKQSARTQPLSKNVSLQIRILLGTPVAPSKPGVAWLRTNRPHQMIDSI